MFKNESVKYINSSLVIKDKGVTVEDVFNQVYKAKKFYKWFNFKPFVWMTFDKEFLDVGCTGRVHFTIPPFSYELSVVDIKKNEYIKFKSKGKYFSGTAEMTFIEKNGGIVYEDPHLLKGKNIFIHKYYLWFLSGNHIPYMNSRYKIFRKNLLKEISDRENK